MSDWMTPFCVYVSRKTASGMVYTLTSPMLLVVSIYVLALLNALLWGGIGVYKAIEVIL